jgi:hypothetical protein
MFFQRMPSYYFFEIRDKAVFAGMIPPHSFNKILPQLIPAQQFPFIVPLV